MFLWRADSSKLGKCPCCCTNFGWKQFASGPWDFGGGFSPDTFVSNPGNWYNGPGCGAGGGWGEPNTYMEDYPSTSSGLYLHAIGMEFHSYVECAMRKVPACDKRPYAELFWDTTIAMKFWRVEVDFNLVATCP